MIASAHVRHIQTAVLRRDLNLSRERMARLVDVSAKTIERWEEAGSLPSSNRVRIQLAQLEALRDLGLTVYTREGFHRFLRTPISVFGNRTALHLIEQGRLDEVMSALATDYEGAGT